MLRIPGLFVALLLVVCPAHAGRWDLVTGLTLSTDFTDNVRLVEEDPESDTVLTLRGTLLADREGNRAGLRVAYAPYYRRYLNDTADGGLTHVLRAEGDAVLIEDFLTIRARANAGDLLINSEDRSGFDSLANPDAYTQGFSFEVVPELRIPLRAKDYAVISIEPGLNYVFTADTAGGSDDLAGRGSRSRARISSGPFFQRMPWGVMYEDNVFSAEDDDGIRRVSGTLGYRFSERYRVDFSVGYDSGRYETSSSRDTEGTSWRATFGWTPVARTSVAVGYGSAYYGDDWVLDLSHRQKRTIWRAGYTVSVTNARQELLDTEFIPFLDPFGEPIRDPITGRPLDAPVGTPTLNNETYVLKSFKLGVGFNGRRVSIDLDGRHDTREYQASDLTSTDNQVSLQATRSLSPTTNGFVWVRWWDHGADVRGREEFEEYSASIGLNRRLGPRTTLGMNYRFADRSGQNESFQENRVNLTLALNF